MFIGIAGPSCSGKSTITKMLAERLAAPALHLDDYYIEGSEKVFVDGWRSFERPHQYDGARLASDLNNSGFKAIADGFLLFTYPQIRELLEIKVYIDLPDDEIMLRRLSRSRTPGIDRGFRHIGIREWREFGEPQRSQEGVVVLDGRVSPTVLVDKIEHLYEEALFAKAGLEVFSPAE